MKIKMELAQAPKSEVTRWYKNGDHPDDHSHMIYPDEKSMTQFAPFLSEGKVVRLFRDPSINGWDKCPKCGEIYHNHGWIDAENSGNREGYKVCPGDYVVKDSVGKYYALDEEKYEQLKELENSPLK
jgi:hypothetical protein